MGLDGYVGNGRDVARIARLAAERDAAKAASIAHADASAGASTSRLVGFASGSTIEAADEAFKASTVGLMTRQDFVARQEEIEAELEAKRAAELEAQRAAEARVKDKRKKKLAKISSKLSFDEEDVDDSLDIDGACDEDETQQMDMPRKRGKFGALGKNPDVETSFLPDKAREEAEAEERKALAAEFLERAEAMKAETVDVAYSFYDGGRRAGGTMRVKQGDTIEHFLVKVRAALLTEGGTINRDLKAVDAPGMMYIKEDLIIPHELTFHELVVTKARGKSGPLFRFDAQDDVRIQGNAKIERQDSHPGKVILRSWYEKNKNMFPANRWEIYEPGKDYARDGYRIK